MLKYNSQLNTIEKVGGALESDQLEKKIRRRSVKINEELPC